MLALLKKFERAAFLEAQTTQRGILPSICFAKHSTGRRRVTQTPTSMPLLKPASDTRSRPGALLAIAERGNYLRCETLKRRTSIFWLEYCSRRITQFCGLR